MSMVAQVRRAVVERKGWMDEGLFSEGVALANLLPGPVVVNVVAWCGYRLYGWLGALIALVAVLWPSVLCMTMLTAGYAAVEDQFWFTRSLGFINAVVVALVISAGIRMISPVNRSLPDFSFGWWRFSFFLLAVLLPFFWAGYLAMVGLLFLTALTGMYAGFKGWLGGVPPMHTQERSAVMVGLHWIKPFSVIFITCLLLWLLGKDSLWGAILADFSRIGLTLFGGGYSIVPLLKSVLVDGSHLLTEEQINAGVSMGQMTPGPVLVSSVFYGFVIGGWPGALAATVGMFVPAATLMIVVAGAMDRLRSSVLWQNAFYLLKACVAGLVVFAGLSLGWSHLAEWQLFHHVLLILSFGLIHLFGIHPVWLVGLAFLAGFLPL